MNEQILVAQCPAASGIIAAVTTFLAEHGAYISEMSQFDDPENARFFMRARFHWESADTNLDEIQTAFADVAEPFAMQWAFHPAKQTMRAMILVSRHDHCLADLLYRLKKGDLAMEVTAVVSNHPDLQPLVEREGLRFIHLPVEKHNKPEQEAKLLELINDTETEVVILARYMQILSNELCQQLSGKVINIHHSFLPGFKGARPYYQAYDRGVKLIGATAHYVTADLDEGPIIEQAVQPVDHTYTPEMLTAVGRDTETVTLFRAVKLHIEHRVFLNGSKTVVFR